ncbi:MAG TPA: glycosyltransferase family 39 protein [Vicinamibacterales bacterium]|jgi:dolichyl-phosphate-mannose-protein mannosyltransferase|nr:glycosyltransferase family 39 protein [Vicinamibacterales bacterium]
MKALRRVLLAAACIATAWSAALVLFGGFNTRVFGIAIRSRNPDRALMIACIAVAAYFVAGGRIPRDTARRVGSAAAGIGRALLMRPGLIAAVLALTLAITAFVAGTRIAGGADAYGYVSQADLWLAGELVIKQPWVAEIPWPNAEWSFSPLGYRPAEPPGQWAIVPTYSPGLPLLLAGAKLLGGQCALFAVVPLLTGLGVLVTYGIGKRLVSPWGGIIAAWLVAASPIVIGIALEPLTDVPVMTVWAISIYLLLARTGGRLSPVLVGVVAGIAILIRPNLVPLSIPLGMWYMIRRQTDGDSPLVSGTLFALGVLPAILLIAFLNNRLYGSPLSSGYGTLRDLYAWSHIVPNLRRYFAWFTFAQTPIALAGLAALFVPTRRLWASAADLRIVPILAIFVALLWGQYFAYEVYDSWGFLRFLLPSWPLIMVGLAAVLLAVSEAVLARRRRTIAGIALTLFVALLGVWTFSPVLRDNVLGGRQAAAVEAPLGQLVRKHTVDNSVVLVWERSGTIRYYSGRTTLRYDYLDREWLDRCVAWLRGRGVHVYAVLDPNHVEQCRRRFAGQATLAALHHPVFLYEPASTALYDLTTPPPPEQALILYEEDPGGRPPCDPPAEPVPMVLSAVNH